MSLKKSVLSALLVLSSLSSISIQADTIGWGNPGGGMGPIPSFPSQPTPWPGSSDPRDRRDRRDDYSRIVEQDVRRYFERRASLDLLLDSYSRNQLLGQRISEVRISMATEMGNGTASLLQNNRQIEGSLLVSRDVREYSFRIDSMSSEVGRSLRSLSLEMQGRFYVDKVSFVLESDHGPIDPFPMPSQTEVLRQQINQTFDREGGLNLFRQFPLIDRQGQIVRRVNIVAMSRGYGSASAMLLENNDSYGQTQYINSQPTRISFDLRDGERIGRELQSLRLQFSGSITVLEVSIELDQDRSNDGGWGRDNGRIGPMPGPMPREPRMPGRR